MVLILPVAETVAKSAAFASMFKIAAKPPLFFKPATRSSLNQTSPRILSIETSPVFEFLNPIINVLTSPKFGFPLIPNRSLFGFEAAEGFN